MATITGFTAERMLEIENSTVVDGEVVGDNLHLLQRDGTPIDAGNVRGPQGVQGVPGPVQSVNDQLGPVYTPRVFTNKAALDAWTPPNGSHGFTTAEQTAWVRIGGSWRAEPAARHHTNKAALDADWPNAPVGSPAYTTADKSGWLKDTDAWYQTNPVRIFQTFGDLNTKWNSAPVGSQANTVSPEYHWVKTAAGWAPLTAGFNFAAYSLGGFPAGIYNWPTGGAGNIGSWIGNCDIYNGGYTQYAGLYTVNLTLTITPSDSGDIMLYMTMNGYAYAIGSMGAYAAVTLSASRVMPKNAEIKWAMYKHSNTSGWTGSWVRFEMHYYHVPPSA